MQSVNLIVSSEYLHSVSENNPNGVIGELFKYLDWSHIIDKDI